VFARALTFARHFNGSASNAEPDSSALGPCVLCNTAITRMTRLKAWGGVSTFIHLEPRPEIIRKCRLFRVCDKRAVCPTCNRSAKIPRITPRSCSSIIPRSIAPDFAVLLCVIALQRHVHMTRLPRAWRVVTSLPPQSARRVGLAMQHENWLLPRSTFRDHVGAPFPSSAAVLLARLTSRVVPTASGVTRSIGPPALSNGPVGRFAQRDARAEHGCVRFDRIRPASLAPAAAPRPRGRRAER